MKHFIAYHKIDVYGPYNNHGHITFRHFSSKSPKYLRRALGQTVWVLSGEILNGRKVYKLCSKYTPKRIVEKEDARSVEGSGIEFNPHFEVTRFSWFQELFKEQQNFSWGFNEIKNQRVIKNLEKIAESRGEINFNEAEIPAEDAPNELKLPRKRLMAIQRVIRDSSIGKALKQRYQYQCQVCGQTIELPDGKRYAEVHHLHPVGKPHNGEDGFPNSIAIEPRTHQVIFWNQSHGEKSKLVLNHDLNPACVKYHYRKIFKGTK